VQQVQSNVFTRPDTLFGVCQAIGDDFGFNPLLLRIAFAVPLIWSPYLTVAAYLALGALVLLTRLLVPSRRAAKASPSAVEPAHARPEVTAREPREEQLPLAA
jgi:phage shock protein C